MTRADVIGRIATVTLLRHSAQYAVRGPSVPSTEGETSMSLWELITRADERGLAASGLACLERCLPPSDDTDGPEPLRPLWASCGTGRDWGVRLAAADEALGRVAPPDAGARTAERIRAVVRAAPREFEEAPLRTWADACSLLALDVHREFDPPVPDGGELLERCRSGEEAGAARSSGANSAARSPSWSFSRRPRGRPGAEPPCAVRSTCRRKGSGCCVPSCHAGRVAGPDHP